MNLRRTNDAQSLGPSVDGIDRADVSGSVC